MEALPGEAVAELLRSHGTQPVTVERLPGSVVYRIELLGSRGDAMPTSDDVAYLKLVGDAELYRQLVAANDRSPGVGLPNSTVIESDGVAALVSEPAAGRPLSRVLPVAFLPGVWLGLRRGLVDGYRAMGVYVETLHRRLDTGRRPIDTEHLVGTDGIGQYLPTTTRDRIESLYEDVLGCEVPTARIKSDLTPHNAFYTDGDVSLIDFSLKIRPRVRELANLRVSLELMARRLPYPAAGKATRLADAFENGYELSITPRSDRSPLLAAFEISYLCKILKNYLRSAPDASAGRWVFSMYDRRCVVNLLERKTQALETRSEGTQG